MIRKQLYLTPEIERGLTIEARRQGKTTAEVVRNILAKSLKVEKDKEAPGAVLVRMAENASKGPKDLSTNLYSYLYGEKSSRYGKGKRTTMLTKTEEKRAARFINEHLKKTSS